MHAFVKTTLLGACLLSCTLAFVGCDDDDDNSSSQSAVVGLWQTTTTGVGQETLDLQSDGSLAVLNYAYLTGNCLEYEGSYTQSADSLILTMWNGYYDVTLRCGLSFSQGNMFLSSTVGYWMYVPVGIFPTCADYNE